MLGIPHTKQHIKLEASSSSSFRDMLIVESYAKNCMGHMT